MSKIISKKESQINQPDIQASWYDPVNINSNSQPSNLENFLKEQLLQFKNKLESETLNHKNDILLLRHEILNLKETIIELKDDLNKYKIKNTQLLDEREKNRLLRTNIPFSFYPIHSNLTSNVFSSKSTSSSNLDLHKEDKD